MACLSGTAAHGNTLTWTGNRPLGNERRSIRITHQRHRITVSEISGALKRTVEDVFGNVRVRGEISGYRGPHSSGHAYFALKDDRARLDAVVWKGTMSRLKFRPEEGMEVIATGKLTTYPGKSNYQIVIDNLEPAGAGALMALLEERKRWPRRRPVRYRAQAAAAIRAAHHRCRHLADGFGHSRHHPPDQGPVSPACARLAGAGAGRDGRRGSGRRRQRLQRAGMGRRCPAP